MKKITFKNLECNEAHCLGLWFEDIKERFELDIDYTNTIIDDAVCDFSISLARFKVEIGGDYIELQLYGHNSEYYSVYEIDFTQVIFE